MSETFDIGPLTWVHDEIKLALNQAEAHLETYAQNNQDVSVLRQALTHLNQVNGALDMVGLEGCKRFCFEIETLVSALEKQILSESLEALKQIKNALHQLANYLQDLLNGQPDQALRLYPTLVSLAALRGEVVEPSVLFFPDLNQSAPKINDAEFVLDDQDAHAFYNAQRTQFQRGLIDWLKSSSASALQNMQSATAQVQMVQTQSSHRTFWWVAGAFLDVLGQATLIDQPEVKKILRRIDQQLRSLETAGPRANQALMKDMLYFIAIAETSSELLANVKTLFLLQQLIPRIKQKSSSNDALSEQTLESSIIVPMLSELEAIKLAWTRVSKFEDGAFANFVSQTQRLLNFSDSLPHEATFRIVVALNVFAEVWDESGLSPSEDALVEVAAGLALLEDALRAYQHINHDVEQGLITQAQRIKNISDSVMGEAVSLANISHALAEDAVIALAAQIKEALNTCERAIDLFFRSPQQVEVLSQVDEPIKQMLAAFEMLNMPLPMEVVSVSQHLIRMFAIGPALPVQFESLADSLSMLALFVSDLPRVNPKQLKGLEASLIRLTEVLQQYSQDDEWSDEQESQPISKNSFATHQEMTVDLEVQEIFMQEAEEVLASIAESIQALRVNITASNPLADLRRGFHTLKGSGRMVGLESLGELAWIIERLLNQVMDDNVAPDIELINFAEKASVEIAQCLPPLRTHWSVVIDLSKWQEALTRLELALSEKPNSPKVEEVLIGGTRKISKALFDIFIAEAHQHIDVLKTAQATLESQLALQTMEFVRRASHTLASNAGAAGFKAIEELSRNFEYWLDLESIDWTASTIKRYVNCVKALDAMLEKAKTHQEPKQVVRLLKDVKQAIAQGQQYGNAELSESELSKSAIGELEVLKQVTILQEASVIEAVVGADFPPYSEQINDGLLEMFAEEANEIISQSGVCLRNWQSDVGAKIHAEDLQRALHTLKGSARMVGQVDLGNAVHAMEDSLIFALEAEPEKIEFDALFDHLDTIANYLDAEDLCVVESKLGQNSISNPKAANSSVAPLEAKQESSSQQLRLRADVLDRLINEAGEISIARSRIDREIRGFKEHSNDLTESLSRLKSQLREMEIEAESTLQSRLAHLQEVHESFDPLEFDRFTRLQELTRLMAESVNDVTTIQQALTKNIDETEAALSQQSRMNRELQYALMNIRMAPFSSISERLHRIVRQTARELDKRVELSIDGEYVDIDRSVLEHMGGALEHLLRNAVAHGLESSEERNSAGKSQVGAIRVNVIRENDEIIIHIADDGAGIHLEKIRTKAEEQGRISAQQVLTEQALLAVIFEPGFTTATNVTQIAGRGVGLDSVRSDVSTLGGRIDVVNNEGLGATFSIHLPVTLSIAQVVMVRAGSLLFALPAVMVEQVQKIKSSALLEALNDGAIEWNQKTYPFHYLGNLVGIDQAAELQIYTPVILLKTGQYLLALHVDEIVANQELVMKPIGPQLARLPGIVGASVLGDGQIVYMLNPIQIAHREALVVGSLKISHAPKLQDTRRLVMIVDDSLTMRKVLSRLLEREGYRVITAINGIDALQTLQEVSPHIILTDIEMPNMDGFELVRQLRESQATVKTPIIMISSRTAEKHQTLAKKIGVNVFMGKPIQDEALIANIVTLLA